MRAGFLFLLLAAAGGAQPTVKARYHHVAINSVDVARSVEFYAKRFAAERAEYAGAPALRTQQSWILFNRVGVPAPSGLTSAIWHIGWGAPDMRTEYRRQLDLGTPFDTPVTMLFPNFYFSYVRDPDGVLIELNSAPASNFGHIHLFAEDVVASAEWYIKHLGLTIRGNQKLSREDRVLMNTNVGPIASLMADGVNVILFSTFYARRQYPEAWKGVAGMVSTEGRVVERLGFAVEDVGAAVKALRGAGVRVLSEDSNGALIEGPDRIRILLVKSS